jgi:hypothetical protein
MESERSALSAFCVGLPGLRARAARGFWQDTLEMHVAEVVEGGSAVAAFRELGLLSPPEGDGGLDPVERGEELAGGSAAWLPRPVLVGDYHCPLQRCVRRGVRDDDGRPPWCALSDQPMRYARHAT